jgi:iron complex outermembrane receptor protein
MKKLIFCIAVLAVQNFHTQEIEKEKNIEEVSILGRKKLKQERAEFKRHGQSVETMSEDELNRNNSAMIDQTLSTMAGVQVDKRTNFGGQRIVVRGYGNDQKFNNWGVKFYWNNIPLTSADGITVLDDIDFAYVNNIEVIKGPASTMYGGGTGGTVRFYTRSDFKKDFSVSEDFLAGSFKTLQTRTSINASDENYFINATYGHLETDGYRPHGGGMKNFLNLNGSVKLGKKDQLSFFGSQAYSGERLAGQITYDDYYAGIDNGNSAYISKDARNIMKSTRIGLTNSASLLDNFRNSTTVYFYSLNQESVSAAAYGLTNAPSFGLRSTFVLKNKMNTDFENQLDFGLELKNSVSTDSSFRFTGTNPNDPLETSGINGASYFKSNNNSASYFAIDHFTYKPWDLVFLAGISANNSNYNRKDLFAFSSLIAGHKDASFAKTFKMVYTPHIALEKEWKKQIFNLSYSEGYNAPTASTSIIGGSLNLVNDNLRPERAKMWDFSVHGLLLNTKLDYQISVFNINYFNKLTQLAYNNGNTTYWANTGNQKNNGLELSFGYQYGNEDHFVNRIVPFFNMSYYDAKYKDFQTTLSGKLQDYSHKTVVGVPRNKFALGIDFYTKAGFYLVNTYNYLGAVYTDFDNTNKVKGFGLLNSKLGYKKSFGKVDLDVFVMGNNLTNQINYTFLFVGNGFGDKDPNNGYPSDATTDVNPGPSKAYFFGGVNVKYRF